MMCSVCAVIGMKLHPQLSEGCGPEMAQTHQNYLKEAQGKDFVDITTRF